MAAPPVQDKHASSLKSRQVYLRMLYRTAAAWDCLITRNGVWRNNLPAVLDTAEQNSLLPIHKQDFSGKIEIRRS